MCINIFVYISSKYIYVLVYRHICIYIYVYMYVYVYILHIHTEARLLRAHREDTGEKSSHCPGDVACAMVRPRLSLDKPRITQVDKPLRPQGLNKG